MSSVRTLLEQCTSVNRFDTRRPLDKVQIVELVRLATLSPSACNFQNWKFIAVRDAAAKERLKAAADGQQKVVDASVTFIVCGTLNAHRHLAQVLQPALDAGILNADVVGAWVSMAQGSHEGNPQLQRDEALRSASLASMTLMLAAQDQGLGHRPHEWLRSGCRGAGVRLQADEVPVILVTVGFAAEGNWAQKPQRVVREVLKFV